MGKKQQQPKTQFNHNGPIFVCSLKRLLYSWQQSNQTGVTHVLYLHHPLLVRNAVHVTPEVLHTKKQTENRELRLNSNGYKLFLCVYLSYLLVVAGDAAEVAVELV